MNSWLYLTAQSVAQTDLNHARVYLWHEQTTAEQTSLNDAVEALKERDVKLILPMELCSWLLTEPWPGRRRPSLQALAFSVEDQLADDLDELHIAVGPMDAQRRYPLLVINRQRFKSILAQLHERGLNIVSVHVDADLLPGDQPCIAEWDGRWMIGGSIHARLALSKADLEAVKPELAEGVTECKAGSEAQIGALLSATPSHAINLLQGTFQPMKKTRLPFRLILGSLMMVFVLELGFTYARIYAMEAQIARLSDFSEQRFKTIYPNHPRVGDLKTQRQMLSSRIIEPGGNYMRRLDQVVKQMLAASSIEVQRIELKADTGWILNITANSFAELEQFRSNSVQGGLPIKLGTASQQGNKVHVVLTLEERL
ncbi:type II secretion system protein GspL [Pseudomonas sp. NPDC096917]|uniref:type II secretion system protein GspL n=1 Tax=Pseudomonas sp. NPDC096917 TaxID=3364483 RepID=UPI00383ADFA8